MNADILHPITMAQVMVNFAAERGVSQQCCLLNTGISDSDLAETESLITREQEMQVIANVMHALGGSPAIGFELGLRYNIATFGLWGFTLRTCRSLRDAVQHAMRYLPLSTAYCQLSLIDNDTHFGVVLNGDTIPLELREFLKLRDLATALNLLRELGLSGISVQAVELDLMQTAELEKSETLAAWNPHFAAPRTAVLIAPEDADRPLPTYDPHLVRMLEDQCRTQLARRQETGTAGQVRRQILCQLGLSATLEDTAAALAISPRSLRRRLEEENTSFRQLVDDERRSLAEQLLKNSLMTLEELAAQLGYLDTASFTRAFRRWHGQSPGQYRKNQNKV